MAYNLALALFYVMFAAISSDAVSLVGISNDYSRVLASHSALGKLLDDISDDYDLKSFSLGDAGAAAFHSRLIALDNVGLGSAMVAHRGMSDTVLDEYDPDVMVFHASPDKVREGAHNQSVMLAWANGTAINRSAMSICGRNTPCVPTRVSTSPNSGRSARRANARTMLPRSGISLRTSARRRGRSGESEAATCQRARNRHSAAGPHVRRDQKRGDVVPPIGHSAPR